MNTLPRRVEVAPFPQGKRIAVTTSFDDGVVEDRRVVAAFNEWGLKGTFNLNSGLLGHAGRIEAKEVADLYRGHEVAVHTVTHPWLTRLDDTQIAREVLEDRMALEDLVGYPVRGMAYPYGDYNPRVIEVLRRVGILYARTTGNANPCFPVAEPLAWPATAHQYADKLNERFAALYENQNGRGVFFVWGHTYEFDRKNDWPSFERIYKPLAGKPDVWYCTNIELFDYEAARQRMVIAANRASAFNPSAVPVTLSVDGKLVTVPAGQTTTLQAG